MKYLFVGDIHNKLYIFDDVERLDKEHNFDKVIFMGDYVDDWNTDNHNSLETLDRVFKLKESNPDKYVLLVGNHEISYLGHPCSGHKYLLDIIVEQKLKENLDKLDLYATVECGKRKYVCTHAGITNDYIHNVLGGEKNWEYILNDFNKDFNKYVNPSAIAYLAICSGFRGGNSDFSSFVWCDSRELVNCKDPIIPYQIVGHTPVPEIVNYVDGDSINYILVDTHSTFRDGTNIGDKSYLFWDEDKFDSLN